MNGDLAFWLASSMVLFIIGIYGLMSRKDAIRLIIAIEILVSAANSAFIGIGYLLFKKVDPVAQTYTILSLGIGGAIIGVALSLIRASYEKSEKINVEQWTQLRW